MMRVAEDGTNNQLLINEVKAKRSFKNVKTVWRIWKKYKHKTMSAEDYSIECKRGSGRPIKWSVEQIHAKMKGRTLWSLAFQFSMWDLTSHSLPPSSVRPPLPPTHYTTIHHQAPTCRREYSTRYALLQGQVDASKCD